jgi:predicted unusual protein kinase regulating ubiquinone biosynthesis (AarF/ABC1/UbiB family)
LVDGHWNADPHPGKLLDKSASPVQTNREFFLAQFSFVNDQLPGNILLLRGEDGSPKLGLIDYGSTKQLPKEKRHLFCKLIIALADDDRNAVVHLMKEAG